MAAILLASGFSKRFGRQDKLLFPFKGKPLARYTLELAAGICFSGGLFFVAASDEVAALAADLHSVTVLRNNAPEKGLRESVRLGVEAVQAEYYIFFPCDQPFLDAETIRLILEARQPGRIVEPRYRGRPGNPCLFSDVFREELLTLKDGETPRVLKTRHPEAIVGVEINNALALEDVDDEEVMETLLKNPGWYIEHF